MLFLLRFMIGISLLFSTSAFANDIDDCRKFLIPLKNWNDLKGSLPHLIHQVRGPRGLHTPSTAHFFKYQDIIPNSRDRSLHKIAGELSLEFISSNGSLAEIRIGYHYRPDRFFFQLSPEQRQNLKNSSDIFRELSIFPDLIESTFNTLKMNNLGLVAGNLIQREQLINALSDFNNYIVVRPHLNKKDLYNGVEQTHFASYPTTPSMAENYLNQNYNNVIDPENNDNSNKQPSTNPSYKAFSLLSGIINVYGSPLNRNFFDSLKPSRFLLAEPFEYRAHAYLSIFFANQHENQSEIHSKIETELTAALKRLTEEY